jgi:outer membrane immunogenic protein
MKIKGFLLATAAGSLAAPVAHAADLAVKAPPRAPVVAAPSWAGFYIGVNAGGYWQETASTFAFYRPTTSNLGFIGGGQLGYNWQSGNLVLGIEGDWDWLSGKGSEQMAFPVMQNRMSWLATVRGRAGLAVGNTLVYATGGLAIAELKDSVTYSTTTFSDRKTRLGIAVGGGIEQKFAPHWSAKLEGLFVGMEKHTGLINGKTSTFKHQAVIGRVGLNYQF